MAVILLFFCFFGLSLVVFEVLPLDSIGHWQVAVFAIASKVCWVAMLGGCRCLVAGC